MLQGELSLSHQEDVDVYRAVSRSAVSSMVLSILGLLAFWFVPLLVLPSAAILLGLLSFAQFRRYPDELTGVPLAKVGVGLAAMTLVGATTLHIYTYFTEVPEGYSRVSFSQLKSPDPEVDVPPSTALELDGKPVFLKGYILPASVASGLTKRFVLVPDLATCCFGSMQPKLTHMVEVSLSGEQTARFRFRPVRLAGTLRVQEHLKPLDDLGGVYYQLHADIYRP